MKLLSEALSAWPIEEPLILETMPFGGNNASYPVVTLTGAMYFLRVYQNTTDPSRVVYEHSLLTHLQQQALSFAVPAPIRARDGSTLLSITKDNLAALVALFPLIPGEHPDGASAGQYRACGRALAELDEALSRINLVPPTSVLSPFGEFGANRPAVPDVLDLVEQLPIEPGERHAVAGIAEALFAVVPALYRTLPAQVIHRDVDASNVLMTGNRVTGILDFEFAGPDLRAFDLARSLALFARSPWGSADGWEWIAAFASGYRERITLTEDEIKALPDLMRLYRVWSLVHREERRKKGLASAEDVIARARALLNADAWLKEHHRTLLNALGS